MVADKSQASVVTKVTQRNTLHTDHQKSKPKAQQLIVSRHSVSITHPLVLMLYI